MATEEQTQYNSSTPVGIAPTVRVGQKLTITNRYVTKLGFWLHKTGAPNTDIFFAIYAQSGDALLARKYWGNSTSLTTSPTYSEVTFDSPVYINQAVYIAATAGGANAGNHPRVNSQLTNVKASENFAYYTGSWVSDANYDTAYRYTYSGGSAAAPTITTQDVTDIEETTATGNGNITSLGSPLPNQHGMVIGEDPLDPSITNYTIITQEGVPSATGAFTSAITGLTQSKLYNVRAYVQNALGGFALGNKVQFSTGADVPVVTTGQCTEVAVTTALGHGSIDGDGGTPVTQHGMCWSTSDPPTIADPHTLEGATDDEGEFFSTLTPLAAETTYYVRAYATNDKGPGYGASVTILTHAVGAPIVTTQACTSTQVIAAIGNGTIVDIGGAGISAHGHTWGTSPNPTSGIDNGAGSAGAFTSVISSLAAGSSYYVRAYATNSYGTSYGNHVRINVLAGEVAGVFKVKGKYWVYTDNETGRKRRLEGTPY